MKSNKNGVKLLAAVMAFAMVFVACFAIIGDEGSSVDADTADNIKYFGGTLDGINEVPSGTIAYIDKDTKILTNGSNVGSIIVRSGGYLKVNSDVTLTIENKASALVVSSSTESGNYVGKITDGTIAGLVIEQGAYVVIDGDIVIKENGGVYNNNVYDPSGEKKQDVLPGVYLNGDITVERGGQITGKDITVIAGPTNQMIVGSTGSVIFKSTSTTPSMVSNQTFSIIAGGSVDIDAMVMGPVLVGSFTTGATEKKITSYVAVGTEKNIDDLTEYDWITPGSGDSTSGLVDLQFSVSDRDAEKMYTTTVVSGYTYAVLDVSGSVKDNAALVTLDNRANGIFVASGNVSSGINAFGITEISKTLDVGKGAYMATVGLSNVLVSGEVNIDGVTTNKANVILAGIHTVTGSITIGPVNSANIGSIHASHTPTAWATGENANSAATVNLYFHKSSSFIDVEGDGEVTIADYNPATFGCACWNQSPEGTHGVSYIDGDGVFHITNLEDALVSDNQGTVFIFSIRNTAIIGEHKYVISSDVVLPEDITVYFHAIVVIEEGSSLTIPYDAAVEGLNPQIDPSIEVKGFLYDYTVSNSFTRLAIAAEVKSLDADQTVYTYTTLKNALAGDDKSITLNGNVVVVGALTIPEGYTVTAGSGKTITVNNDSVLTIDGKLILNSGALAEDGVTPSESHVNGKVIVNGVVEGTTDSSSYNTFVDGAFYSINSKYYITSASIAAENSANTSQINFYGDIVAGDLVFTKGTGSLAVNVNDTFNASSIEMNGGTLTVVATATAVVGKITIDGATITSNEKLTAEITAPEGIDSQTTISVDGFKGTIVSAKTSGLYTCSISAFTAGSVSVDAGSAIIGGTINVNFAGKFSIDEGATVTIAATYSLTINNEGSEFVVDGELIVNNTLTVTSAKTSILNGTLKINAAGSAIGKMQVLGSIQIKDGVTLSIYDSGVVVGTIPGSTGSVASVTGTVRVNSDKFLKVYAGSDISGMKTTDGKVEFNVDGTSFATVFFNGDVSYTSVISKDELNSIAGVGKVQTVTWSNGVGSNVTGNLVAGDEVYTTMPALMIGVKFSIENGTQIKFGPWFYSYTTTNVEYMAAGEYSVVGTAIDGSDRNVIVELWIDGINNGVQTGTINLTKEMSGKDVVIVSTFGTAPVDPETPVDPSEDYIVSTSVVDDKVVVSVISLDGGYLVAGTEVTVTFTALEETTAFGQTIYKPTPVTKTITIGDDKPTISNNAYELADILGDKYAVINVVSTIGTTGYGNMSLNYKG